MYTEEILIFKLKLKDIDAIHYAYKKYGPALYGIIHRGHSEHADLIFTKAFKRVIDTIGNYDPVKCRLFTWIYWIVTDEMKKVK